jgi:hypothetical protein
MTKKRTPAQRAADALRPGRPPKKAADRQNSTVLVRMTKAERKQLESQAKADGLTLSALLMRPWREDR